MQRSKCNVRGCQWGYTGDKKEKVSLFSLPRKEELRKKWLQVIPTGLSGKRFPKICENHFLVEDIIRYPKVEGEEYCKRSFLKRNTVPSVFSIVSPDPHAKENDNDDFTCAPCIDLPLSLPAQQFLVVDHHKPVADPVQSHSDDLRQCISLNDPAPLQSNSQKGLLRCEHCAKPFLQSSSLKLHLRMHTGENCHRCDKCNKAFTTKYRRDIHLRIHEGRRPYQCDHCSKGFIQKSGLASHLRSHTGERPYQCKLCNKYFTQKSYLFIHVRLHTGERPYQCNFCNEAFIRKTYLKRHLHTHSGKKPCK